MSGGAKRRIAVTLPDDHAPPPMRLVFTDREIGSVVWPWAIGMALVALAILAFLLGYLRAGGALGAIGFALDALAALREARLWRRYFGDAAALIGSTFEREEIKKS